MRLDTFLLADHAVAAADGKLYINGGGITQINAPAIPFAIPSLSVVLRFSVDEEDVGDHQLLLQMQNPQKMELLPQQPSVVSVAPPLGDPDEEKFLQVVLQFGLLPILVEGTHQLTIRLDGKVVRRFRLPAVLVGQPAAEQA